MPEVWNTAATLYIRSGCSSTTERRCVVNADGRSHSRPDGVGRSANGSSQPATGAADDRYRRRAVARRVHRGGMPRCGVAPRTTGPRHPYRSPEPATSTSVDIDSGVNIRFLNRLGVSVGEFGDNSHRDQFRSTERCDHRDVGTVSPSADDHPHDAPLIVARIERVPSDLRGRHPSRHRSPSAIGDPALRCREGSRRHSGPAD